MIRIYLTVLFCLSIFFAKAQPNAGQYGCMSKTSPTRVYQLAVANHNGLPTYKGYGGVKYSEWTTQYDITSYPCIAWNPVQTSGCYIQTGASTYTLGDYGYFSGVTGSDCPIDKSIFLLFVPVGFFAVYNVKKVKKGDNV